MKISYAITVCNEFLEIQRLLPFLLKNKRLEDEVVVLFDSQNGDPFISDFLRAKCVNDEYNWCPYKFDGHFANLKNKLTELCSGDYIYQIDADEMVDEYVLRLLPQVLEQMNNSLEIKGREMIIPSSIEVGYTWKDMKPWTK